MKKKSNEENKKTIKNYVLLVLLFGASILLVLYVCELYKVNQAEKMKVPVIDGELLEIYSTDLEHYVLDNPTTIIYMCTANDDNCRMFERDFKKLLKKNDYNEEIIYLNLTDLDQDEFVNSFNEKYNYKIKLTTDYPAFVLFEDGKVKNILQGGKNKRLNISRVKEFLELNIIGE